MLFFPLAATLISAAFALTLGSQYRIKRRPYLLAWCVALTIYSLATLTEVFGAAGMWSPFLYRAYYFLSAVILVGVLGLGTIYLLAPRFAQATLVLLLILAGLGLIGVLGADLQTGFLQTRQVPKALPRQGNIFNLLAISMVLVLNLGGTIVLIGGALWSAYGLWRRGQAPERVMANILIAAGALITAFGTGLSRLGIYELFYVAQAVGVLVMFLGFLAAQRVRHAPAPHLRPLA